MGRPSAGGLFGIILAVLAAQSALLLGKGVLLIDRHEGDAIHVLDIALRMGQGQWPHLDFMTPLGVLAFAPVAWLMQLGLGAGHAIMGSFILFAAVLAPAVWWAALSRLQGWVAYLYGAFLMILCTALIYGGGSNAASISMYYNRWGWAVIFVLAVLAVLPAKRVSQGADGVVFGLGLSFLALAKATFFVAFLPGILAALLLRRQFGAAGIALAIGVGVIGLMTVIAGLDFWTAYIGDLRETALSPLRVQPGDTLNGLLTGSGFIAANLCLLAAVVLLRQAELRVEGLVLLLFAPAFIYVTYQNWGNDPKWLLLLAVILVTARPDRQINNRFGWNVARCMGMVSLVSLALILPSVLTLTLADLRHARLDVSAFTPFLKEPRNADLQMRVDRMFKPVTKNAHPLRDGNMPGIQNQAGVDAAPQLLFGQPLPRCMLDMGMVGIATEMARDVDRVPGITGKSVFVADTFSDLWMFGDTAPVPGGAPWFYGSDTGLKAADYVLVPLCPITYGARELAVKYLAAMPDGSFQEVQRSELYILLKRQGR